MEVLFFAKAFTAFFVIIDPIGMSLLFNALADEYSGKEKIKIAVKACTISALILICFGIYGEKFLSYLGISIDALKISGGILLFYTAFKMVTSSLKFKQDVTKADISVFPLSIPLLAGPGSLTVSILMFSEVLNLQQLSSTILAISSIFIITLFLMCSSDLVRKIFRDTADEVLRRFLGMILAALAVQFVIDGFIGAGLTA